MTWWLQNSCFANWIISAKWRLRDLNPTLYPWRGYVLAFRPSRQNVRYRVWTCDILFVRHSPSWVNLTKNCGNRTLTGFNRPSQWYNYPFTLLRCKIPDAKLKFELTASWSQTRHSPKLSQSGICSSLVAPHSGPRTTGGFRESLTVQRLYRGLNPDSQPWQGCGITSYPIEPCSAYSSNMLLKDIPAFFSLQEVNQVGRVRLELTVFLAWRFYRPLASAICIPTSIFFFFLSHI